MMKVNIIVNVYNGEVYLSKALETLVSQEYENISIHCFDNHSTDKTQEIINEYANSYSNLISYSTTEHIPLVEARNYALSILKKNISEPFYFGYCDADDLWDKNWVSSLMAFGDLNYDLLVCNYYSLEGNQQTRISSCLSQTRPSPFSCPVGILSCLFSSSLIEIESTLFNNDFPISWDTEFWIRRGLDLSYLHISDHLCCYRIHSNSLVQANFIPLLHERWGILKLHKLSKMRFIYGFIRQIIHIIKT